MASPSDNIVSTLRVIRPLVREKRRKAIYALLLLIIVCLCGCNKSSDNVIEEVNSQEINKDAQTFIQNIKDSNGVFLFSPANKDQFLIIKYSTVLQGVGAKYLRAISSKITDRKLIINIEELATNNYDDERLRETNGEEAVIELVSG